MSESKFRHLLHCSANATGSIALAFRFAPLVLWCGGVAGDTVHHSRLRGGGASFVAQVVKHDGSIVANGVSVLMSVGNDRAESFQLWGQPAVSFFLRLRHAPTAASRARM